MWEIIGLTLLATAVGSAIVTGLHYAAAKLFAKRYASALNIQDSMRQLASQVEAKVDSKLKNVTNKIETRVSEIANGMMTYGDNKIDEIYGKLGKIIEHEKGIVRQMIVMDDAFKAQVRTFIKDVMPDFKTEITQGIKESLGSVAGSFRQIASVDSRMTNKMVKEAQEGALKGMIEQQFPGAGAIMDSLPPELLELAKKNPQLVAAFLEKFKKGGPSPSTGSSGFG